MTVRPIPIHSSSSFFSSFNGEEFLELSSSIVAEAIRERRENQFLKEKAKSEEEGNMKNEGSIPGGDCEAVVSRGDSKSQ